MKIISGGQTGADQAGWRAAKACGLETGGLMPKGFMTEEGDRPEFAELFGATESFKRCYVTRTRGNARTSDATIFFQMGSQSSRGQAVTARACFDHNKTFLLVRNGAGYEPARLSYWIMMLPRFRGATINIAGNRESGAPGIGHWVEEFLIETFLFLGHKTI